MTIEPTDEAIKAALAVFKNMLAPVDGSRRLNADEQKIFDKSLRRSAKSIKPAPVDDEVLVYDVANVMLNMKLENKKPMDIARAALSVARPVIEAAEREKIANTIKEWGDDPHFQLLAAAIRRDNA